MSVIEIPLTKGYAALIDEEDIELIEPHNWQALICPKAVYARTRIYLPNVVTPGVLMHRLIMSAPVHMQVDHINHNGLDCRRENLRLCTRAQNAANQALRADSSSGYKGVSWHKKSGKWTAQIGIDGQRVCLGFFVDPWEAAQAYNAAARAAWGEFAALNECLHGNDRLRGDLRPAPSAAVNTRSQKLRKNCTSGYMGVSRHSQSGRWVAQITIGKCYRYLGLFDDPWEAAQAYNVAARAAWGDAAYINVRHPEPAELVSA